MYRADTDRLLTCPYNETHRISAKRFSRHILLCQVNYPNVVLEVCPYNANHRMPKAQFLEHLTTCPDSSFLSHDNLIRDLKISLQEISGVNDAPPYCQTVELPSENWLEETKDKTLPEAEADFMRELNHSQESVNFSSFSASSSQKKNFMISEGQQKSKSGNRHRTRATSSETEENSAIRLYLQ